MSKVIAFTKNDQSALEFDNLVEQTMSHIEIAEVAGRRSDSVKRTIERLVKEGAIPTPQIVERQNQGVSGSASTSIHLMLDRLDSITVMATVNSLCCATLVKRWDDLESGKVEPVAKPKQFDLDTLSQLAPVYQSMRSLAEAVAPDGKINPLAAAATEKLTGYNLAVLFDIEQQQKYAACETDKQAGLEVACHSRKQVRDINRYDLEDYLSFRELADLTGLQEKNIRTTLLDLGVVEKAYRSVNKFDPKSIKYFLTDLGWKIGVMFDPSTETIFTDGSQMDRIIGSNAQPVFGYDILNFFN